MVQYGWLVCDEPPNRVVLTDPGTRVLEVVKVIGRWTGLSLWRGKMLVSRPPATILEDVSADMAERAARELREAGAAVEIRHEDLSTRSHDPRRAE